MYGATGGVFGDTRRAWSRLFNYSIGLGAAEAFVTHYEGDRFLAPFFSVVNLQQMYLTLGPKCSHIPERKHSDGEGAVFGQGRIFLRKH